MGMQGGSLSIVDVEQAVVKASGSVQGLPDTEHLLALLASDLLYRILPAAGFVFSLGEKNPNPNITSSFC